MPPHDDVWKHLLERKGLAAAASVLEEYGVSCEADMSHLAVEDLGAFTSKLRPLQLNLLRRWVEGLATAPVVSSAQSASDKVESPSRGKEKESEGQDGQDEDEGEEEEEEDEEILDAEEDQATHRRHEVRDHQVPSSGEVYQASGPEKGCQGQRHLCVV